MQIKYSKYNVFASTQIWLVDHCFGVIARSAWKSSAPVTVRTAGLRWKAHYSVFPTLHRHPAWWIKYCLPKTTPTRDFFAFSDSTWWPFQTRLSSGRKTSSNPANRPATTQYSGSRRWSPREVLRPWKRFGWESNCKQFWRKDGGACYVRSKRTPGFVLIISFIATLGTLRKQCDRALSLKSLLALRWPPA